ncbi:MAG: hypothetical protein ACI4NZ_03795 [Candidatus Enterousia sp.]
MKTKIIYISGSEVFDMRDIRAAFDQVRSALQLGTDTVLFGVPVDKTDALSENADIIPSVPVTQIEATQDAPEIIEPIVIDKTPDEASDAIIEPVSTAEVITPKKTRGRPKSVKKAEPKPIIDEALPEASDTQKTESQEKVVSILSVLTAKNDAVDMPDADTETVIATPDIPEIVADAAPITEIAPEIDIIDDTPIDIDTIDITDTTQEISVIDDDASQTVSIDDMITDDAPIAPQEKTLEQLLESMAPLREDLEHEQHIDAPDSVDEFTPDDTPDVTDISTDDDATLEQLATEFAENQDKIEPSVKTENHGKIGKLKNILPFKKARRDDAGLMGDLFGWAGIAANDEDFAIPGFFTNAASKK